MVSTVTSMKDLLCIFSVVDPESDLPGYPPTGVSGLVSLFGQPSKNLSEYEMSACINFMVNFIMEAPPSGCQTY